MKLFQTTALGLALALGTTAFVATQPVAAKEKKQAAPKYSEAIGKNLPVAQKALDAGDLASAKTAIAAAEAGAASPDDKYAVGATKLNLGIKSSDTALQAAAIDMMIDSGSSQIGDKLPALLRNQAALAAQAKNYPKAEAAMQRLVQVDPSNGDNAVMLAEIKIQNKKPNEALPLIQQAIAAKKQAGQPVTEDWYKRGFAIAYQAKNVQLTNEMGAQLVAAFPSADNWRDTIQIYRELNRPDTQADLDLYRLQRAAKALKGERDFFDYANSAYEKGLPGEAVAVIDEGTASRMLTGGSRALTEVKGLSSAKVSADKASLPGAATRAKSAANGRAAMTTADAYLGYGDYAKAAELYQLALTKGGVDADTVNTRLGIALARGGNKAGAVEAFGKVSGPQRKAVAAYWTAWLNQQA